jgi:hypothetical protein
MQINFEIMQFLFADTSAETSKPGKSTKIKTKFGTDLFELLPKTERKRKGKIKPTTMCVTLREEANSSSLTFTRISPREKTILCNGVQYLIMLRVISTRAPFSQFAVNVSRTNVKQLKHVPN